MSNNKQNQINKYKRDLLKARQTIDELKKEIDRLANQSAQLAFVKIKNLKNKILNIIMEKI